MSASEIEAAAECLALAAERLRELGRDPADCVELLDAYELAVQDFAVTREAWVSIGAPRESELAGAVRRLQFEREALVEALGLDQATWVKRS